MPTVWNSADKTAAVTLSNGDHTASVASGGNEGVQATAPGKSTGKWYIEFTGIATGGFAFGVGFDDDALSLGSNPEFCVTQTGGVFVPSGGSYAAMGTSPNGVNVSMAIDLDNEAAWVRYDGGSWYGHAGSGADPSTPATGFPLAGLTTPWLPSLRTQFNPTGATINAGDTPFDYTEPSGYVGWDAVPPIPPTTHSFGVVIF